MTLQSQVFEAFDRLLPPHTKTLVVGVSGGADSMALTLLARDYAIVKDYDLQTATVDHQLRQDSAAEALWVEQALLDLNISHQTLIWHHQEELKRRHEQARKARYQLLLDFCKDYPSPVLLTAHHQQDQAETILMRFLKGSGPDGFQGIRAIHHQHAAPIVRPLLGITPQDLRIYLQANSLTWIEDPSNQDSFYERTRVRKLLSHLGDLGWQQDGILASAAKIYELQQNFAAIIGEYAKGFTITDTPLTIDQAKFYAAPQPVQRDWLRQQIWQIGEADYPKPYLTIEAILRMLKQPKVNDYFVAGCLIKVANQIIVLSKTQNPREL